MNIMDLKAISYYNIGPFKDKLISIFFDKGKYLIKAPIGTGKSFLFFDGPIFALYKYSTRNILNIGSNSGFIKIWFNQNDQEYLLIRQIKKGKSKDSCTSLLFLLEGNVEHISEKIIVKDLDIEVFLKDKGIKAEEIKFKNETDLQSNINDFLPPKEVFLSTVFLVQDSVNIFELQPAERLIILKNVFGLLGIDDAKEKITDSKRQIQTELRIRSDHSAHDKKLKELLKGAIESYKKLYELEDLKDVLQTSKDFFYEKELIQENITIKEFSFSDFPNEIIDEVSKIIEEKKGLIQKFQHEKELIKANIDESQNKSRNMEMEFRESKEKVQSLTEILGKFDPSALPKLKDEKKDIIEEQNKLKSKIDYDKITEFCSKNNELLEETKIDIDDIASIDKLFHSLINNGKVMKEGSSKLELELQNLKQQEDFSQKNIAELELKEGTKSYSEYQNKIEYKKNDITSKIKNLEIEIVRNQEKLNNLKLRLDEKNKKIIEFDEYIKQQGTFDCTKISGLCPFVKEINKSSFEKLDKNYNELIQERANINDELEKGGFSTLISEIDNNKKILENELKTIETDPSTILQDFIADNNKKKNELIAEYNNKNYKQAFDTINNQIININQKISIIKDFLNEINRKDIQEIISQYQDKDKDIKLIDVKITELEEQQQKLDKYKMEIESLNLSILNNSKTLEELNNSILALNQKESEINKKLEGLDLQKINNAQNQNKLLEQNFKNIQTIIIEYKDTQIYLRNLEEKEKIINNLYQIFSKELLLLVIENSLPSLNDIINNFLSQVVEYQINLFINTQDADKLELEAKIYDEKGERDIKSLSGGQKTILKLVWMLSICVYTRGKLLFLDETINNLDQETISNLTEMLEDFIKKYEVKLFVVTHSQQIQSMSIRNDTIDVEKEI